MCSNQNMRETFVFFIQMLRFCSQVTKLPNESMLAKTLREQHFPIELIRKGLHTQLEKGAASVQADKERILASMKASGISHQQAKNGFIGRKILLHFENC